jgi:hypothetical protein
VTLRRDLSGLSKELQLAGLAAAALAFTELLPWYQQSVVRGKGFVQTNLSAFQVFTPVEAAVLVVALAVLYLVWARSQRRGFHLPGGDGLAITIAGGWAVLLLVWRLFDRPDEAGTVGIQWGFFAAFVAAGALIAAGARVRAAHAPEPPNPAADEVDWEAPPPRRREPRPDRRPRDAGAVTEVLRDRPAWEGEPREPSDPSRARTTKLPDDAAPTTRLPDDAAPTTRLPDDAAPTERLPEPETRRLWDDDDPPR